MLGRLELGTAGESRIYLLLPFSLAASFWAFS